MPALPDQAVPEVRGVHQGLARDLQAARELLPLPAVHVPPAAEPVPPGLQQQPRRDGVLQGLPQQGKPDAGADHGAADPLQLQLLRAARARAPRHQLHPARQDPPHGHFLPDL